MPSTLTAATTLVQGTITTSITAGAIVGPLVGGAAAAALPLAIRKVVPELGRGGDVAEGEEGEEDDRANKKKSANVCTVECTANWVVSTKKVQTTSSCPASSCMKTVGCNFLDATQTNDHATVTPFSVATITTSSMNGQETAPPLNYGFVQVYLAQEYLRLQIGDDGSQSNQDARCEKDTVKDLLEMKDVKVIYRVIVA